MCTIKHTVLTITLLLSSLFYSSADVKLPALVSDHMVLQQNTTIIIWGWAAQGEKITVMPGWTKKKFETITNGEGKWQVDIKTPKAGGPYCICVNGQNKIQLKDVMIGEVWLCSGQSNMHLMIGKYGKKDDWRTGVDNYKQEIATANYPAIRMFTVERKTSDSILQDVKGDWVVCSPDTAGSFSAVAYFYGRELYHKLKVPIGLLNSSWGGTPAEAWTRKEVLVADTGLAHIVERHRFNVENWDSIWNNYKIKNEAWKKYMADTTIANKKNKPAPKQPIGPGSHKAPYLIYNAMIAPLLNYKIKGVIWYQGENNAPLAWQYRTLFPAMINCWRTDFHQGCFPFYFVQIAPHRSQNPEIRESQLMTYRKMPNIGMAVTTDVGDNLNIHPTNKQTVGYRLSLWALANTYHFKNVICSGPLYRSMKIEGDKIRIFFDFAKDGLVCKGDSLIMFEIAGNDRKFMPAVATIEKNTILVSCSNVKNPVAVRFAWNYLPIHNLYNKTGLPASPFRTDDWPEKTFGRN